MTKPSTTKGAFETSTHVVNNSESQSNLGLLKSADLTRPRLHNRIQTVMVHVSRYSFQGRARLAADVGVSRSTISRLINGQTSSSHTLVQAVTDALSARLGKPLVPRDLFSPDGYYPECSGCRLCACRGCLPEAAFDGHGRRRVEWQNAIPGDWSLTPQTETKSDDIKT